MTMPDVHDDNAFASRAGTMAAQWYSNGRLIAGVSRVSGASDFA